MELNTEKMKQINLIEEELNKYIVGSFQNKKTGCQKCKKCGADVVNLSKIPYAYDTIRIYQEHEKKHCENKKQLKFETEGAEA